jgi:ATP-dependent helicase/nuclease subunit B
VQGANAQLERAEQYIVWAQALDRPAAVTPVAPPKPKPPAGKRLTRISVTDVEKLIRDPYAIYARRILRLDYLQPIGAPAGPAERGTAVHAAIERFGDGTDAAELLHLLEEELRRAGAPPERRAAERERLGASVAALIAWFAQRRAVGAAVYREEWGDLMLGEVKLVGKADRIEIADEGGVILDFKTGAPPTNNQVNTGLSPQLLLEAAMLARGAFARIPKAHASELIYWRVGTADPAPQALKLDDGAYEAGEKAFAALVQLLAAYADPKQAFLSKPRVQFIKPYAEYDHLARRKEWADADGGEA